MAEHVTLIGAEAVGGAGHNMAAAAREMTRAAEVIDTALAQQRQFMDDWLNRLQKVLSDDTQTRMLHCR